MSEEVQIEIRKSILHILDNNAVMPVLSSAEQPLEGEVEQFLEKHLLKILNTEDIRTAYFEEGSKLREICAALLGSARESGELFIESSSAIAQHLFAIMRNHVDIPAADLICCTFELDGELHLGVLKMNYRPSFIHHVAAVESGNRNYLIKQLTTLPGEGQKVDECALINLVTQEIKLIEKKYEIDGEKRYYFSELFLQCAADISTREKLRLFKKVAEEFNRKYRDDDIMVAAEISKAVSDCATEAHTRGGEEEVNFNEVAERAFGKNPELQRNFVAQLESAGLKESPLKAGEKLIEKHFRKQKLETDNGIEITLPVDYYQDPDKVEFINNPDGTVSLLIKNTRINVKS